MNNPGPCVYRLYSNDWQLLYIGSTANFAQRIALHRGENALPGADLIHRHWMREAIEEYPTIQEARAAEREAIRNEGPLLNRIHNPKRWTQTGSNTFEPVAGTLEAFEDMPVYSVFLGLANSKPALELVR